MTESSLADRINEYFERPDGPWYHINDLPKFVDEVRALEQRCRDMEAENRRLKRENTNLRDELYNDGTSGCTDEWSV